ncbi:MAG: hypothetical protein RJB11_3161 [Planctomycetota bacterium]|jgi:hypothetical protein
MRENRLYGSVGGWGLIAPPPTPINMAVEQSAVGGTSLDLLSRDLSTVVLFFAQEFGDRIFDVGLAHQGFSD